VPRCPPLAKERVGIRHCAFTVLDGIEITQLIRPRQMKWFARTDACAARQFASLTSATIAFHEMRLPYPPYHDKSDDGAGAPSSRQRAALFSHGFLHEALHNGSPQAIRFGMRMSLMDWLSSQDREGVNSAILIDNALHSTTVS
jgi:hypothetical protein